MRYTVRHATLDLGSVELPDSELAAGVLVPAPDYESVRSTVRAATAAFLELGLFGAAALPVGPGAAHVLRLRRALARANRLRLELVDERGSIMSATFVNLLETPASRVPVVVACFSHAPSVVGAEVVRRRRPGSDSV